MISRSPKPCPFSNIPPDRRNSPSCPEIQQTIPLKNSSSSGAKRWRQDKRRRQDKRSRPGRWPSCANTRTNCGRIMSACEPYWRLARPRNDGDLLAHFLHIVLTKVRRSLYPTTLTYRRMTSYLLTTLRSHGVHPPRTPRKPNPEKGPLVDPANPSVPRNAGYGEKPIGTDASQSQLMNMCPNNPGASAHQYPLFTLPSGLLLPHTCFSPPPSEDHNTCSPLPSVNIFWIMILLAASLYRSSPCTTDLPIHTITSCISTK